MPHAEDDQPGGREKVAASSTTRPRVINATEAPTSQHPPTLQT